MGIPKQSFYRETRRNYNENLHQDNSSLGSAQHFPDNVKSKRFRLQEGGRLVPVRGRSVDQSQRSGLQDRHHQRQAGAGLVPSRLGHWRCRDHPELHQQVHLHLHLVPDDNAVSPRDFPEFFKTFMKNAEKASNKKYFMAFDNIIHREVDGALYEAADWIVEGFGRGTYFNTAKNGRVTWDMATQSQLGQDSADRLLIMPLYSQSVYLIKFKVF